VDSLLDRFLRYVQMDTTSVEETDAYPSSPGQLELARLLAAEMETLGVQDVEVSEHAVTVGTLPGNVEGAPTIAWFAHLDTSPETPGKDVKPIVLKGYDGLDITLPGDRSKVIRVADTPALAALKGKTIIHTDGTTLLGADDKAGIACIMTAAAQLLADPDLKHGPIRLAFTPDEEVGRGTDKVDVGSIGATCGYTVDGDSVGLLENATFSADMATVTVHGTNTHPGFGYGKMANAIRFAADFLVRLPANKAPETTKDEEGFLHPYVVEGGVSSVTIRILLRSFVTAELAEQAQILRGAAAATMTAHPKAQIDVDIKKQYRNMSEYLQDEPRAVELAAAAYRILNIEPKFTSIRGGTDGSRLSEKGLPTPNLSCGMHNFHSPLEFACLEEMETAVSVLVELAQLWGKEQHLPR
jgi:tripeptide aminopeptidase